MGERKQWRLASLYYFIVNCLIKHFGKKCEKNTILWLCRCLATHCEMAIGVSRRCLMRGWKVTSCRYLHSSYTPIAHPTSFRGSSKHPTPSADAPEFIRGIGVVGASGSSSRSWSRIGVWTPRTRQVEQ